MRMVRRARKEAAVVQDQQERIYLVRFRVAQKNMGIATWLGEKGSKIANDARAIVPLVAQGVIGMGANCAQISE
jgi:hypothetical protein